MVKPARTCALGRWLPRVLGGLGYLKNPELLCITFGADTHARLQSGSRKRATLIGTYRTGVAGIGLGKCPFVIGKPPLVKGWSLKGLPMVLQQWKMPTTMQATLEREFPKENGAMTREGGSSSSRKSKRSELQPAGTCCLLPPPEQ